MVDFGVLIFALNRIEKLEHPKEASIDTCDFWYFKEEYEIKYFWSQGEEYLKITLSNKTNIWEKLIKGYNPPKIDTKICVSGRAVEEMIEDIKTALTQLQVRRSIDVFDIYSDIFLGFKKVDSNHGIRR